MRGIISSVVKIALVLAFLLTGPVHRLTPSVMSAGSATNPACSKWWSYASARVMSFASIVTNEMQSVSDHALSGRCA